MSKPLDINEYCEQLTQICAICKKENKCKDKTKICMLKRYAWLMAKKRYSQKERENKLNESS